MKPIPADLQAHYDTGNTCVAVALLIRRADREVFAFTSHDQPFSLNVEQWLDGETTVAFDAAQGLDVSTVVTTAGLQVDNMEFTTLDDGSLFTRDDIQAGVWRDAELRLFRYRWDVAVPTIDDDVETLIRGWTGEVTLGETTISFELRGLTQRLQQPIGIVSTKTCRVRLGSVGLGMCNKDLTAFTHALTVTGVTDKRTFTASGATQDDDYFGEGVVVWETGNNAGIEVKVREFAAGAFTLVLPVVLDIQVGDTFTAVAGCRKRHSMQINEDGVTWTLLVSDCKTKFDNILNFQGEPHRPQFNDLVRPV